MRDCIAARIATGEVVHIVPEARILRDASLIRADVAWESLAVRHVEALAEADGDGCDRDGDGEGGTKGVDGGDGGTAARQARRHSKKTGRFEKVRLTDPDATMATSGRNRRLEPSGPRSTGRSTTSAG